MFHKAQNSKNKLCKGKEQGVHYPVYVKITAAPHKISRGACIKQSTQKRSRKIYQRSMSFFNCNTIYYNQQCQTTV